MGENSVRSGRDGEKIANEILRLIGWNSPACNVDIDCSFPTKHNVKTHGIDIIYSYDNPLYHNRRDIIIGSSKHFEDGYPSGKKSLLKDHIFELSTHLSCSKESDDILNLVGKSSMKTQYKGLLFWLSSLSSEKNDDIIDLIDDDLDFGSNQFEEIYIIDNKRATFLVSCIKNAESYFNNSKIRFLYQNTGKNMDKEQLLISGNNLPIQLINSKVIPIVKENNGIISCLIFCENGYSKENLSRLIWFSHKLCGLTNEIRIYFPDYDNNKEFEVNGVKQSFKDESLTARISAHRFSTFDFISLKENQNLSSNEYSPLPSPRNIKFSDKVADDIEKILPYGDMLLPKLKTSILTETNLKDFLFKKGIVVNKKLKDDLLPIFSCLLLSPQELDSLKATYKEKEDKPKEIERNAIANLGNQTLWEVFNSSLNDLKKLSNMQLPKNCTLVEEFSIERVDSNYNHLIVKYQIEKTNTNKDFLTGKSKHDGEIEIKLVNQELTFFDRHTSSETYQFNKKYYEKFEKSLKKNNFITGDFKSISFLDFNNKQRIQFLLSFLELKQSSVFKINSMILEDMRFRPDETMQNIPIDLESLKNRVTQLNLHGKELNETVYFTKDEYITSILCEKVRYYISYNYLNRKGTCFLEISFYGALGKDDFHDSPLRLSILPCNNTYDTNFSSTKIKLNNIVNRIKNDQYLIYKQS